MSQDHYLFITDGSYTRDDRNVTPCHLSDHLNDLRNWGGTPDFFDSYQDLGDALDAARVEPRMITVTDDRYRILYTTKVEAGS